VAKKHIPADAITIRTYAELHEFATKFAEGAYKFLAVVGTAGLAKSETFKAAMAVTKESYCLVKGHATAFIFYKMLYDHLDELVVIDDADTLYQDKKCQPLLKCLCETSDRKTMAWHSRSIDEDEYPRSYVTTSKVAILCNEWQTVSQNMKAIVDRGIYLNFVPTALEVHRMVGNGSWLNDNETYGFVEKHLRLIGRPSMRYYDKIKQLRTSGVSNWRDLALNMLNPDLDSKAMEVVSKLLADDSFKQESKRVDAFIRLTKLSRATYFRYKSILEDS
jgi:hypothetical protein